MVAPAVPALPPVHRRDSECYKTLKKRWNQYNIALAQALSFCAITKVLPLRLRFLIHLIKFLVCYPAPIPFCHGKLLNLNASSITVLLVGDYEICYDFPLQ
jgi:hypothetical protein